MSVSVKIYDFTVMPGGSCQIQAVGTYFRIYNSTGAVSVTGEFGEVSPLLQGQGLKDAPFTRLQIKDKTGQGVTGQVLVASSEFVDQQMVLSGAVVTSRSMDTAYKAGGKTFNFSWQTSTTTYPQLWQRLAMDTGKVGWLRKIVVSSQNPVTGFVRIGWSGLTQADSGPLSFMWPNPHDRSAPSAYLASSLKYGVGLPISAYARDTVALGYMTGGAQEKVFSFEDRPIKIDSAGIQIEIQSQASFFMYAEWDE